jgi:hypothetical protein
MDCFNFWAPVLVTFPIETFNLHILKINILDLMIVFKKIILIILQGNILFGAIFHAWVIFQGQSLASILTSVIY